MAKTLYLIDGHYQMYRAYFSLPERLTSPRGEPTGATHVFCMMLASLIRDRKPDYFAVTLDVSDETVFRRHIDGNYKANRDPAPEALHIQINRIVSIMEALEIPILRVPGFEADDVMATIAHRLRNDDIDVYLVSRDKDLEQTRRGTSAPPFRGLSHRIRFGGLFVRIPRMLQSARRQIAHPHRCRPRMP